MEFRLYNKPNCNLFDLIGKNEPDQTKGLGLVLSESKEALLVFLKLIKSTIPKGISRKRLLDCHIVVDCEQRNQNQRTDLIISFYDKKLIFVVIIEAKSINKFSNPARAAKQLENYIKNYSEYNSFDSNKIAKIILTNTKVPNKSDFTQTYFITWKELIDALEKDTHQIENDSIVNKYINYLTEINGSMKHYTNEVLSIPAGNTLEYIEECNIYVCPSEDSEEPEPKEDKQNRKRHTHYGSRAKQKPLFIACREKGGKIHKLYKIKDIIQLYIMNNKNQEYLTVEDTRFLEEHYSTFDEEAKMTIVEKINKWCQKTNPQEGYYHIFIFDNKGHIVFPKGQEVIEKCSDKKTGLQVHSFPLLASILQKAFLPHDSVDKVLSHPEDYEKTTAKKEKE